MIDLRSDTVTRPTPPMLAAMMQARVGDDVFGEDETVNALEQKAADLFGMQAALFCPSGTMTNQIAIRVHTRPGDEVICHELSHIYLYEGGGIAANSGASVRLLTGDHGRFTAGQVREAVNKRNDSHLPWTRLVAIENTVNKGGGACWNLEEVARIREVCDQSNLILHLDGARLFNAMVVNNESPRRYGELFHTVSICLSKGLGAPIGSLLLGAKEHIAQAHRLRKMMGGGMRQAGYLAAAGIYALDNHVERLAEDHRRAGILEERLREMPYIAGILPVQTNIVIFELQEGLDSAAFLKYLKHRRVHAVGMGKRLIRFVCHLQIGDADLDEVVTVLRAFKAPGST